MIETSERTNPERKTQFGSGQKPEPLHTSWGVSVHCQALRIFEEVCASTLILAGTGAWGGGACVCGSGERGQCDWHTCKEI